MAGSSSGAACAEVSRPVLKASALKACVATVRAVGVVGRWVFIVVSSCLQRVLQPLGRLATRVISSVSPRISVPMKARSSRVSGLLSLLTRMAAL